MKLELTFSQASYIADYINHEFNLSFELDSSTSLDYDFRGADAILDAVKAINGGATDGY